ncbi:protease [Pedobacter mucosus]|uniref:protease n=1 Tax=Pedobacter mucosus TaxID=2895286 RepID=UPI001EE3B892|nr:protease [Pedobacter mucosus]UKT64660.1 protease [Pedobacter mucosus]
MITILLISSAMLASCGSSTKLSGNKQGIDSNETKSDSTQQKSINGKISQLNQAKIGSPINLKFMVFNSKDSTAVFCKWHTPFEPLSSKYLDVIFQDGTEANFIGPMAKRMMPPPANSYQSLKTNDSISVNFDLTKAYAIIKAGSYTIKYNSTGISGITIPDSLKIIIAN